MEKKKTYKAIIFDLDGTLLNTLDDLMDSVNAVMRQYGMPEHSSQEIKRFVGNGIERLMELSVPGGKAHPLFEQALTAFREHYARHCNDKTNLYPGIREMMARFKQCGYLMAVVSNKYQQGIDLLMEQYFRDYLSAAVGEISERPKKPAPDGIYEALRQLGVTAAEAVYIGDSEVDIMTARNAGMYCITVGWGFRTREELKAAGGTVYFDDPEKMTQYFMKVLNRYKGE